MTLRNDYDTSYEPDVGPGPLTAEMREAVAGIGPPYTVPDWLGQDGANDNQTEPLPASQSQSLCIVGTGIEAGPASLTRVWELPEPAPRDYYVGGLIPKGAITLLYADGGMYKSLIVLYICIVLLLGQSLTLAGRALQRCKAVLFLDSELDIEEFTRRAYHISRGLGLTKPPEGLHYMQLSGPLSNEAVQAEVRCTAMACQPDVSVVDSLTIASYGSDPTSAPDVTGVMKYLLETLQTVICIDHIAKPQPGANSNLSEYRPFGSVFKGNLARSVIQAIKADGGGVMLKQKKHNFGPLAEPMYLAVEFSDDKVTINPIAEDAHGLLSGMEKHLPAKERIWLELTGHGEVGARVEVLAQETEYSVKTIKNKLTELRTEKRAEPLGGGCWRALKPHPAVPTPQSLVPAS